MANSKPAERKKSVCYSHQRFVCLSPVTFSVTARCGLEAALHNSSGFLIDAQIMEVKSFQQIPSAGVCWKFLQGRVYRMSYLLTVS